MWPPVRIKLITNDLLINLQIIELKITPIINNQMTQNYISYVNAKEVEIKL